MLCRGKCIIHLSSSCFSIRGQMAQPLWKALGACRPRHQKESRGYSQPSHTQVLAKNKLGALGATIWLKTMTKTTARLYVAQDTKFVNVSKSGNPRHCFLTLHVSLSRNNEQSRCGKLWSVSYQTSEKGLRSPSLVAPSHMSSG